MKTLNHGYPDYWLYCPFLLVCKESGDNEVLFAYTNLSGGPKFTTVNYKNVIYLGNDDIDYDNAGSGDSGNQPIINVTVNGGMSSGEFIAGQTDFWGNQNSLSGDEQEGQIDQIIGDIQDTISGEIANNEVQGLLNDYEEDFKALFNNPSDFRIFWGGTQYQGKNLIPSGEINFSKLERENQAIGQIMTYVRTIINFIITYNLIKSAWNLLMTFLGTNELKEEYDENGAEQVLDGNQKMIGGTIHL